ncbi:platelet glycoprotein V-like [Chrysoperla carnea]|uniref:platelet glycoprotein V-like n=1 Tax=Chrysoperla carnea TaxID=189513 RepID=UPI001D08F8AD|nr:platelet glycoprotein V-like [Chrysoperla carnea]
MHLVGNGRNQTLIIQYEFNRPGGLVDADATAILLLFLCFNNNYFNVNAGCRASDNRLNCDSKSNLIDINNLSPSIRDKINYLIFDGFNETKLTAASFELPALEIIEIFHTNIQEIEAEAFENLDDLTRLTLHYNAFYSEIQPNTFYGLLQLTELTIFKSPIQVIKNNAFRGLSNLEILDLHENRIRIIEPNAFESLKNLKQLKLNNNQIQQLPKTLLRFSHNIVHLELQDNDLLEFTRDHFVYYIRKYAGAPYIEPISSIQHINLANNQNFRLHSRNFDYDSIIDLDLSDIGLTIIEPGVFSPTLKKLTLYFNRLTKVTNGVFNTLTNLTDLSLRQNLISLFDNNCFDNMVELRILDLSINYITELPEMLFKNLSKLEYLYLYSNRINFLRSNDFENLRKLQKLIQPKTFSGNINLKALDLSENKLLTIDEGVFDGRSKNNTSKLTVVRINYNPLTYLGKDGFLPLVKVQELNLDSNEINQIELGTFRTMTMLESLSLKNNSLQTLSNGLFTNLFNLENIYLDSNKIRVIEPNAFGKLNELKLISLEDNLLETFPNELFTNVPNLKELILAKNNFKTLPDSIFSNIRSVKKIDLSYNNLKYIHPLALNGSVIESLSIFGNNVTFVEDEFFINLEQLKYFTFDKNPIQCKCYFQMVKTMEKYNIIQDDNETWFQSKLGVIPVCTVTGLDTCVNDPNLSLDIFKFFHHIIKITKQQGCFMQTGPDGPLRLCKSKKYIF